MLISWIRKEDVFYLVNSFKNLFRSNLVKINLVEIDNIFLYVPIFHVYSELLNRSRPNTRTIQ